jgi:23S rRNA (adenine2030-N6)-methyltransferase
VNYRHAFHAGNHADVLKHVALLACLAHLGKKPAPFAALDAFAGPGLYDLEGDAATRSPEFRGGVGQIWNWERPPPALAQYRNALRAVNADGRLRFYPGSPKLIRSALREDDRMVACELHPEDAASLKANFRGDAQTQIHARDGYEALPALMPPAERRGLALIDPPYEKEGETQQAAASLRDAARKFSTGVFLWWRPLKVPALIERLDADLAQGLRRPLLRADLWISAPSPEGRLTASSIAIINPPFGVESILRAALPALAQRLAAGDGAGWRLSDAAS